MKTIQRTCKTLMIIIVTLIAIACAYDLGQREVEYVEVPMSVRATQLALIELGYYIEADNIWGPATERAYCNYMAVRSIERMKGE